MTIDVRQDAVQATTGSVGGVELGLDTPSFTFDDCYRAAIDAALLRDVEPRTIQTYDYLYRTFLREAFGHRPVSEVTAVALEQVYGRVMIDGFSKTSVRKAHAFAHLVLQSAVRFGWVSNNQAELAHLPKGGIKPIDPRDVPTPEAVRAFIGASSTIRDGSTLSTTIRFGAATGLRPGELAAVLARNLDAVRGVVTVDGAMDYTKGTRRKDTKTHRIRKLTLDTTTLERVSILLEQRTPEEYLFHPDGRAPHQGWLAKRFNAVGRASGIWIAPKWLRHFHATQLLASGRLSVSDVAQRLGHANPNVTLAVYAHAIPVHDDVAAGVAGELLDGEEA